MAALWKKGRGKLGFLQPLLGNWAAEAETPMGPVRCTRVLEPALGGNYIRMRVQWKFGAGASASADCPTGGGLGAGKPYEEEALIGAGEEGKVCFWSFTSDGKNSRGTVADVTDLHEEAIGFEAQMPAGLARMAYWPDGEGGFFWVVESKTKKGWSRFVNHHYRPA